MENKKDGIIEFYEEALRTEFQDLKLANPEKKDKVLSNIESLTNSYVDVLKEEHNYEDKTERLKLEQNQYDDQVMDHRDEMSLKQEELKERKKSRWWDVGIAIGSSVGGAVIYLLVNAAKFHFEEEHTFTSSMKDGAEKYIFGLFKRKKR